MPLYEVRRRTVLASSVVEAPDEMQARIKARDVWQQDAAIASLSADVIPQPPTPDDDGDSRSEPALRGNRYRPGRANRLSWTGGKDGRNDSP